MRWKHSRNSLPERICMLRHFLPAAAFAGLLLATPRCTLQAQDFSDPGDLLVEAAKRAAAAKNPPEIDGTIKSLSTAKAGWYGLELQTEDGRQFHVMVVPKTKFYADYKAIKPAAAYAQIKEGQRLRLLHDPSTDDALHQIIAMALMFVPPPIETDGTIKTATPAKPDGFDLVLEIDKGGKRRATISAKTKFYKDYKPIEAKAALAQLLPGQKVRVLSEPPAKEPLAITDLMFVDR
jgi:hypothetical protein